MQNPTSDDHFTANIVRITSELLLSTVVCVDSVEQSVGCIHQLQLFYISRSCL